MIANLPNRRLTETAYKSKPFAIRVLTWFAGFASVAIDLRREHPVMSQFGWEITNRGFGAHLQRWRTAPCGKTGDGIHIRSQTGRSLLRALSGLAARGVSVHPHKQHSAPICRGSVGVRFDLRAFSYRSAMGSGRMILVGVYHFCQC